MKKRLLLTVWVCAVLLASCGGGGGGDLTDGSKTSALSACEPASGPIGTKVVCAAKGIEEDSTLFFGKGNPIDYTVNAEEETVAFTVVAGLPGERQIFWQAESGVHPIGVFDLTAVTSGEPAVPADTTAPAGGEAGDVINPMEPGGPTTGPATGGEVPLPDTDGDGVADASDACPGTVSGTAVDGKGCPLSPPTPTGAEIVKFVVEKSAAPGAELMTFHVDFEFVRAKEAYVWGNVLNRTPSDGSLAAAEQCKIQGDRSLRTNEIGKKLNPGTDPYTKLPVEGILCDNTNCRSSSSSAQLDFSPKDGSRFNDVLLKKDLYAYQNIEVLKQVEMDNKMVAVSPGIVFEIAEKNPSCRLDLKKDGNLVTAGEFYFRSHAQYGNLCLVLLGDDNAWKVQCVTGDKLKASNVAITASSVSVPSDKMAVTLKLDYSPGTSAQATGCSQKPNTMVQPNGLGHYEGECAINALTKAIDVTVYGVGENNKQKKSYTIELGSPTVTLKPMGTVPLENETGDFKVQYKAVRNFTIKEEDSVLQSGEASWFQQTYFEGFKSDNGYKNASAPSEFSGDRPVTQDMSHNEWWFGIKDFDGKEEFKKYTSPGYPKTFNLSQTSGGGGMDLSGSACNTGGVKIYHLFNWSGKNIKSLSVAGDDAQTVGIDTGHSQLPTGAAGEHFGTVKIYRDLGSKSDTWTAGMNFTVTATFLDDSTTTRHWNITGWSCN